MNYGYTCKTCGETVLANDKEIIKLFKKQHHCNFVKTKHKTKARKSLAPHTKAKWSYC